MLPIHFALTSQPRFGLNVDLRDEYTAFPSIQVQMDQGDRFYSEAGGMISKTRHVTMDSKLGGFRKAFGRIFSGEPVAQIEYSAQRPSQTVTLAPSIAGHMLSVNLDELGGSIIAQRGAYFASEEPLDISLAFRGGLLGAIAGEGIAFQRIQGHGEVFLAAGGAIEEHHLKAGESLDIDTGCLVAMSPSVRYKARFV